MGMIHPSYNTSTVAAGRAKLGYRGLAVTRTTQQSDERLGYVVAHEMGHCFRLSHAPSPGASDIDTSYPYGGGGKAGGWGYTNIRLIGYPNSPIKRIFLSENSHTVESGLNAHWDVMAYPPKSRAHNTNRFSDYYAAQLKTAPAQTAPPAPAPEGGDMSMFDVVPGTGIRVFGPRAAQYEEQMTSDMTGGESRIPGDLLGNTNLGNVELDFAIPQSALASDPDGDGTGRPDIIVTRVPRVKGLEFEKHSIVQIDGGAI
jgi:hypothetical protein